MMLTIILARRGSTRCPNKNILPFDGHGNLVELCLEKARQNEGDIVVNTDYYPEELMTSPRLWEDVQFMERDHHLCGPDITSEAVVASVLKQHDARSFCLMQATTPLLAKGTLSQAKAKFDRGLHPSVIAINPAYQPNGAFYFCNTEAFKGNGTWWLPTTFLWPMSWEESVDINYPHEFCIAQAVHRGDYHRGV